MLSEVQDESVTECEKGAYGAYHRRPTEHRCPLGSSKANIAVHIETKYRAVRTPMQLLSCRHRAPLLFKPFVIVKECVLDDGLAYKKRLQVCKWVV